MKTKTVDWMQAGFIGYKNPPQTNGGYRLVPGSLVRIDPVLRHPVKPLIYEAIVIGVPNMHFHKLDNERSILRWDEDGRVSNVFRKDCNIDPKIFDLIR